MKLSLRNLVLERDHYACYHCGATEGLSIQHRANRGMGGSKLKDRADNLITFCSLANAEMESDAESAGLARVLGWKLGQWQSYDFPVWSNWENRWFVLTEDGQRFYSEPPLAH